MFEAELKKIDEKVAVAIKKKVAEFSFEIREELIQYPEIEELGVMVDNLIENYRFMKTMQ